MTRSDNHHRIIAIVGPTGSGKTALSLQIAQRYHGEIICADSRTVYKGMDIGTAKPTREERASIPHYLLDIITPDERFSVSEFQRLASQAITDIQGREKLPIVVGGTGLYVDALLYNYSLRPVADPAARRQLDRLNDVELRVKLDALDISLGNSDRHNRPRLIRALETNGTTSRKSHHLAPGTLLIGVATDPAVREKRLRARVEAMLADGLMSEVASLLKRYGAEAPGLNGIGYRVLIKALTGETTVAEATEVFIRGDIQLAKRQMTWFKRNPDIQWVASLAEALGLTDSFIAKAV